MAPYHAQRAAAGAQCGRFAAGELIAGALITETVFGLSGIGQLTQQAVNNQDVAVLQAVVMISALAFVLINLLVDLLMPLFDPRLQTVAGGNS